MYLDYRRVGARLLLVLWYEDLAVDAGCCRCGAGADLFWPPRPPPRLVEGRGLKAFPWPVVTGRVYVWVGKGLGSCVFLNCELSFSEYFEFLIFSDRSFPNNVSSLSESWTICWNDLSSDIVTSITHHFVSSVWRSKKIRQQLLRCFTASSLSPFDSNKCKALFAAVMPIASCCWLFFNFLSRNFTVSARAEVISVFKVGGLRNLKFSGTRYSLFNFSFVSLDKPFLIIGNQRLDKSSWMLSPNSGSSIMSSPSAWSNSGSNSRFDTYISVSLLGSSNASSFSISGKSTGTDKLTPQSESVHLIRINKYVNSYFNHEPSYWT